MPDSEYSSLREAVNRIMGAPAGGGTQGEGQQGVGLAPRTPYSQELSTIAPRSGVPTASTIRNTFFDPFAEQKAANAALQAQNAQMTAQMAAPAAVPATVPAATAGPNVASIRSAMTASGASPHAIDQTVAAHLAAFNGSPLMGGASTPAPALKAPTQPRRNASWQESAQYWKDLDVYRKAGGT